MMCMLGVTSAVRFPVLREGSIAREWRERRGLYGRVGVTVGRSGRVKR
jgi:hypothetical protein